MKNLKLAKRYVEFVEKRVNKLENILKKGNFLREEANKKMRDVNLAHERIFYVKEFMRSISYEERDQIIRKLLSEAETMGKAIKTFKEKDEKLFIYYFIMSTNSIRTARILQKFED